MKFAHLADIHIGGWREEKLNQLTIESFEKAITTSIEENVAFVIISGDLFNTALPNIDLIKKTSLILRKLKENNIECYVIPGSHDFSPSGKTMIDVFENAGLVKNVMKIEKDENLNLYFTTDKTGANLTGLYGKTGGLERLDYEILNKEPLEEKQGFKIFLFHHIIEEFKEKGLEMIQGIPLNKLPKNFNYYAGGHPHLIFDVEVEKYGRITYPGPTFPNNFVEIEKLKQGGFYLVNVQNNEIKEVKHIPIKIKEVESINIKIDNLNSFKAHDYILEKIENLDIKDKIVTLRIKGTLSQGKVSDINFNEIIKKLEGAYVVLKNINKLQTKELEEINIDFENTKEIEEKVVKEFLVQNKTDLKEESFHNLIQILEEEKVEGEKNLDFEKRLEKNLIKTLDLEDIWNVN
jgi:DNA repair protein SbcD/Mre11